MTSRPIGFLLITVVSLLIGSCCAHAADIYVDAAATGAGNGSSWVDAFTTIQAGIDAASPGDTVWVNAGVYTENIDFRGKAITVTSTDPLNPAVVASTIIDGGGNDSVVTFASGEPESSVLQGFTIRNGTGKLINGLRYGGGIYCGAGCSPTIRHNRIVNCTADVGGAVYTQGNSAPQITAGPSPEYPYVGKGSGVSLTVSATDPDGDALTYTWTPLDGGSITGSGSTVTYTSSTSGLKHIRVTVSDGRGGTAVGECTVTVIGIAIQTPLPQLIVGQGAIFSATVDPQIDNTPEYPVSITWSLIEGPAEGTFDSQVNGRPDATTIEFTPTASGPGRIKVEYTVGNARASDTVAINLSPIVDSIEPSYGVLGTTVQATITGKNLARVTGVSLLPDTGVTGSVRPGKTETLLPVEFVISSTAVPGNRTIVLIVPEGQINTSKAFELRTPPAITADPTSLNLLTGQTGQITFSIPDVAPTGGVQLVLSSSVPVVATVPGTATIPEGQNSVVVTVMALSYGQTVITANATGYYRAQVPVTVINPPLISFSPSPLNVARGLIQKCTVSISNPAPEGGLVVSLTGGGGIVEFPPSVVIQHTKLSTQFEVRGLAEGSTAITASAAGYPSTDLPVNVTPGQLTLFPGYLPIAAGRSSTLQLMIPNEAPPGGLTANVVSSNSSIVAVPSTVTIPEGQKSVQIPVSGVTAGEAVVTASAEGFTSAQATVKVLPTFNISFLPGSLQMPPGVTKTTDVVISAAAPEGGLTITLSNPAPDKISLPETAFIPEGSYAVTIQVTGLATTEGPVEVVATCPGLTDGTLQVTVQPLLPLYMRADVRVGVGCRTTGSIGLTTGSAPSGGYTVNVSVDDPTVASVPSQVTIPAGNTWTQFTIVGKSPGTTNCRLTLIGYEEVDTVTVVTPTFTWDSVLSSMNLGQVDSVRVYTYVPGGSYGYGNYVYSDTSQNVDQTLTVSVSSSNPGVIGVPGSMTIPAGRYYSDYIDITAVGVGSARLTASAAGWDSKESVEISVTGVTPYMRADVTVGAGCRTSGSVGLSVGTAPSGGYTFNLSSDNPAIASVPSQVTIPSGSSWVQFTIVGVAPGTTKIRLSVPAELGGYTEEDTVTVVTPTFTWDSVLSSMNLGQVDSVRVYTYVPGGSYGYGNYVYSDTSQNVDQTLTVSVSSSNPGVISVPGSMTIPAGRYYSDSINVTAVGVGSARLTASAAGWDSKESVEISVTGVTPYMRADVTVGAGCRTSGSVGLSVGTAPSGGYTFNLSSDNPAVASVPSQVTIPSGSSWVQFTIVGVAPGTTKIRLSVPAELGGYTEEDTVTVVTPTFTWDSVLSSMNLGQVDSVRVYTYVPGGSYGYGNYVYSDTSQNVDQTLTVSVSSSNPGVISVPGSMTIPAGRYYSDYIDITAVGVGSARLTASAAGWDSKESGEISVTGVTPYMRADVTVGAGCRTSGSVGLSVGTAPSGGYTFNLSSDNPAVAVVPSQVTIPSGSSWVQFTIVGVAPGTTKIRLSVPAELGGYTEEDTVTVVTPTFTWDSVPSQLTLGATDSVRVYTYVPGGSYAYGNYVYSDTSQNVDQAVTVNLMSQNPGVIQIPATTSIPAGRYYSDSVNISAVGAGSSTLVAGAAGFADAVSGLITVVGPWMRADVTVGAGCRTTGYVGLTGGVAPTGGYTVSLTVDTPGVVSVPATVTIPSGSSQVSFNIEGLAVGSTFVQMSVSGFVDRDQVAVVTPTFEWYSVAASLTVGQSDSVYIQTYVPGGTYASGNGVYSNTNQAVRAALTVAISSENPAVLTAPETVTITAGNTWSGWFNMTGVSVGTSRLTASAIGWNPAQTGVITVNPAGASIPGTMFFNDLANADLNRPVELQSGSDPDFPEPVDEAKADTHLYGIGGPAMLMIPAVAVIGAEGKSGDGQGVLQGWNSGPRIEYNVIWGNNADVGGAIAVYNSTVTVLGNIIAGNSAEAGGGAIYVDGSLASVVVRSNTIFANTTSSREGGGVYLAGGSVSITNCILWQNTDDLFGCSATYSDVTDIVSDPGTGNISVDPGFVQTSDPFGGDYCHLEPGSQCVNAGHSGYTPLPGETDIDGQARIASGRVDIGADELPDLNPPDTTITGGPAQGTTVCLLPVNFSWTGSDDTPSGITYSWRIDNGPWSEWSTSLFTSYQSLSDGSHTFEVKARDSSGNEDATPARRDFALDTAAPVITDVLPNAGRTSAIITWKTNEGSTSQVLYGLTDSLGQSTYLDWTLTTSHTMTISNLVPNTTYFYRVRSRDGCGHESTSELLTFTTALDTTPPDTQITSGPSQNSTVCTLPVTFGFVGSDDSTPVSLLTYSYRVDGGSWSEFSSSTTALIDGLSSGVHTFEVKSRDSSGNEDATPASRTFFVRLDPPIISNVQSNVSQMQCTITWSTDVPCTSQVRYGETTDYGSQSPLSGSLVTSHSVVLNGLSPNKTYHYVVVSRDSCGREAVSADQTFTTPPDTGEPNTWFTEGPSEDGLVCSSSQRFCWSGSDTVTPANQLTYSYKLDSGSWSAPTSETCRTFTALTEGGHTLYVRAHDTSGNVDSTPAQRSFKVDLSVGTISNVNAVAGATEATVVWRTSEAMDSQVEYGTTTSYGLTTPLNPSLVTDHTVVISNLTPETTYHYRVKSKDGCGREVVSGDMTFTTRPDQTAPQTVITSGPPANGKACSTTVDFCWTGSDDATPVAELVYSYRMDEQPWSAWTAEICHQFTNLSEGLHTFMVKARDSVGNEDASPAVRYFYVDLTAPTISEGSVSASPRQTTCIINWRTTEPTTSQVEYGTTTAYGKVSAIDPNMLSVHKVTISGLTPETTYHYRVRSSDGCQEVVSEDYTFTTTAIQPPNLRPTQLTVPITTSAHSTVKISWVVQNAGPGDAEGSWTDRILFSEDEIPDDQDVVLWEGAGSSPLPVPYTYSKQAQVEMPMKPVGLYYVILRVDAGATLSEVNETDNVLVQPVTFTADKPLVAAPENINIRLDPGVAAYGQFDLSNIGNAQLTGIVASVVDAPANINLSVSNVTPTMDALTNRRISYQVTASDESVLTSSPKVVFATNEGASATVVFNLTVTPRQPKLVANPGYLSGPMIRGKQTFYECEIVNQGGVPANDLRVLMPTANWLSLVTPADLGSLGPGEKKTVALQLSPPADMPLGDYTSNFVVVGTNANVSVGFRFTCVSTQVGGIKVYAEDEFTTFADDHPYVAGATVTLKDYSTGELKYQGTTGPDGIWLNENVIEANYYLEVSAEKHGTYRSPVQIVAGQTKEVHAFMPRQLVTYKWTVEPIMIEDKYRIVLEATFETHVPAPVVTIEPRTQVIPVVQGQTAISYITVTNHGLISAHEVEVRISDTANWYVTPAIRMIGELPAMTSVRVPIYVRAKADGPITDIPQVATSTLAAEAAMAASSTAVPVAPVASLAEGGGTTGGEPSLCDILSGAVVHIVYCSGGQWKTADFSLSPIFLLLDLLDALGCLTGNIQSCLSLACSLAKVDPCICALIDPLSIGGAINIAQCLACHGFPGGGGGGAIGPGGGLPGGGGSWSPSPGGITGPPSIEEEVPCDPATRPQGLFGVFGEFGPTPVPTVTITSPPDIAKYGGKLVRYRVNLLP